MAEQPRREFLRTVGAGAVASAALSGPAVTGPFTETGQAAERAADADRIVVGVIGTGGMGGYHVRSLAARKDVQVKYVCDVDEQRAAKNAAQVESTAGRKPNIVGDLRKVLDDKSVHAVFIATPDHWHAPAAILALDAGKHVYVEKPCCHNINEGRLMVEAVKRTGKLLQVGTQSRSTDCVHDGVQRVLKGEIGEVLVAKAWNSQRRGSIGHAKPSNPPGHLDFDTWVGPAPMVPYQKNLLPGIWRWWYDFGCGDIGNDGVHDIDVALWGLGVEGHPRRATCIGEKLFFDDDQQFPDTQYAVFHYPEDRDGKGKQFIFEQRIWTPYTQEGYENGAAFYGTQGMLLMGHVTGWRMYGPRNKLIAQREGRVDLIAHHTNFFECIRGNQKQLNADIHAGHRSATIVHLANIAARVGRAIEFDSARHAIVNDDEANALVRRKYRDHWGTPS